MSVAVELQRVVEHAAPHAAAWFTEAAADAARFHVSFAAAGRKLGAVPIGAAAAARITAAGLLWPASAGVDECGRAALLLAATAATTDRVASTIAATTAPRDGATIAAPTASGGGATIAATTAPRDGDNAIAAPATARGGGDEVVSLVRDLLRRGDARERQAVLRVLAALPEPGRFVELAIDACRTNIQTVFEAIACDNAYPARHFPDAAYFQMVLKALFVGAPVARIAGLAERTTPELVRMVDAFASERRAAGRPVPEDVQRIGSPR